VRGHVRRRRLAVVATGLALVLAGCGDEPGAETAPNIVQPGAPGQASRTLSAEEASELGETPFVEADVSFMQGMIHHHAQALRMTRLVKARTTWRDLRLVARRIELSQKSEIDQMGQWLLKRGEQAPVFHAAHGHAHGIGMGTMMPGMLTEADFRRLGSARGKAFDRLFLRLMIRHHEGALTMVRDLYDANGGAEPEMSFFANHVDADQQIEIARMQGMLATR
jgi:uncharacterized protein (DUF305 family)